jgi:phage gpG-like protein
MATTGSKSLGQAGVVIEAPGAATLARRLQRWGTAIEDARPAFEQMFTYLNKGEGEIFDSQGSAFGHRWPQAADPERKSDPRLLVATGALRASLATQTGESERVATATEMRFGTRVPYGRFHETGTKRMPARPFIGMPEAISRELVNIMHRLSVQQAESSAGV